MQISADHLSKFLYETCPDPVLVTDIGGGIVGVNSAAISFLGYTQDELLGMDPAGLNVAGEWDHFTCENPLALEDEAVWVSRNATLRHSDGGLLEVELRQRRFLTEGEALPPLVTIVRDLSTFAVPQDEKVQPNRFLTTALDSVSHGIAIYDEADRLVLCNAAYRDMHEAFTPGIRLGRTYESMLREALETGRYPDAGDTKELIDAWIGERVERHNNPGEPYIQKLGSDRWIQCEDRLTADNYRVGLRVDVSAQMRAKSEAEQLGFILEGVAQEVYLINPTDRSILYANNAACTNLQFSMDELRGMDARHLNAEFSPAEVTEKMGPLLSGQSKVLFLDTRHKRKDGTVYVCRLRIERMEGAAGPIMVSFGEDITERVDYERELERKRNEFESLVRSLPDIITRASPDTTLTYVNENYARFTGRKQADMIGHKFIDFVAPEMREQVVQKIKSLTVQKPMKTMERWMKDHAGRQYRYSWTNLMTFENGQPVELVSVGRDITESHKARQRITRQKRELALRNDALEQFAGIASHDLKAPLRQIRLFAEMIAEDVASGKTDELGVYSGYISDRGRAMERLISSLLVYSQLAYQAINPTRFNLSRAVDEAWDILAVHVRESSARVIQESDVELHADMSLIIQLLQNLFANSLKYRNPDLSAEVRVGFVADETMISIVVEDNGIGIDPENAEVIFEAFQRLHRDESKYSGSGLGLALCRRIAESHGGNITLDASFKTGSRFVISLPRVIC